MTEWRETLRSRQASRTISHGEGMQDSRTSCNTLSLGQSFYPMS